MSRLPVLPLIRNDAVDGGAVGAGHTVTVLYQLKLTGRPELLDLIRRAAVLN